RRKIIWPFPQRFLDFALGATRTSIWMAFVVYFLHILRTIFFYSDITSGMIAAIILMVGIIIEFTWVLEVNRRSSQYRLILTLRHAFHQYEEKYFLGIK
ncbi:MAG: hypothetical protein GFH27_549371n60, partial [Chloroflexi bacterium AL-W]|nr:hypothetical protein [Chloroflexi bacterium AL-N1]NOK70921.1 hypothetical protein [Chloroflexi bacterium AL-N10]NOK78590.1 hypothetical protein [Chloroflexi bacterium AL-N5]NOK85822.1 hypothetical protein [Chloroflexi bacterium AL-W]NOK92738.1 hypothetical protein [Chloroflexi bacterium AL-N15]